MTLRGAYTAAAVSKGTREAVADWMMLLAAPFLFISLFMTWSHQFSRSLVARYAYTSALQGIPRDPTAWQVYSIADVLLAALAVGLLAVALGGSRSGRIAVLLGAAVALAFVIHALAAPPTDGANLYDPSLSAYASNHPTSGPGELVALAALGLAVAGVLISFAAD